MKATPILASTALIGVLLGACGGTADRPAPGPDAEGTSPATPSATASPSAEAPGSSPSSSPRASVKAVDLKGGWPAVGAQSGAEITRPKLAAGELIATGCKLQALRAAGPFTGRALEFLGPEDSRKRQVARFADPATARATLAAIVAEARSCPTRDQDGATAITEVEQRPGHTSITTHYTYEGELVVGAASLVALQRGRAVLLSSMANEASGADGARTLAELDLPHARTILARVCAATTC